MRIALFYFLLGTVVIYAFVSGKKPERIGASIMLVGTVVGHLAWSTGPQRLAHIEAGALAVDIAALAAFSALAVRTDRNWTLWLAALQLIGTLAHLARAIDPGMLPAGYAFLLVIWSYPMLLTIALGTRTQQKKKFYGHAFGS
ncbi:MAG TPA: hypothetical protein VGC56_00570 [Allosphingosinicella sp.]|jgi:hypothetical protein